MTPCNCGKKKKSRPWSDPKAKDTKGVEGNSRTASAFILRTASGTRTFGSHLEAKAAQRRAGGGTISQS